MPADSAWDYPWDYDEPFEPCPRCNSCGNYFWTGKCGNPEGRRRRKAVAAPSTSSKPRGTLSLVPGTKEPEEGVA